MFEIWAQILSLMGAFLILAAHAFLMRAFCPRDSYLYLSLNLLGGLCLLFSACVTRQIGFILLEGFWTGFSFLGIAKTAVKRLT